MAVVTRNVCAVHRELSRLFHGSRRLPLSRSKASRIFLSKATEEDDYVITTPLFYVNAGNPTLITPQPTD